MKAVMGEGAKVGFLYCLVGGGCRKLYYFLLAGATVCTKKGAAPLQAANLSQGQSQSCSSALKRSPHFTHRLYNPKECSSGKKRLTSRCYIVG